MKKFLFYIVLVIFSITLKAETYYVSTIGDDNNPGTIVQPFYNLNHGILQLVAGDTLFIRSGVYLVTSAVSISANPNNGTKDNPIVVMGYPGDNSRPIIDGSLLNNTTLLRIENKSHWIVKNIEIRESHDTDGVYTNFCGINCYSSNQIKLENIIVHDIDGQGFRIQDCDTIYIRDCDSYNNYDPYNGGGKADGFQINGAPGKVAMVYFDRCRAWNNSDDGWDFLDNTRGVVDSCWAWNNGYDTDGSGQGFKAGLQTGPPPSEAYVFTNNVAVYNSHGGMRANCNNQEWFIDSRWYNNTVAFNLEYGFNSSNLPGAQMYTNIWRNNISYNNVLGDYWEDASTFIRDHNSWDSGITLTDVDFISVDSTGISAPRNLDGTLPKNDCYVNFLKLHRTSDCVNAGIDVGLPYKSTAPDIGAFETNNIFYVSTTGNDSNPGTISQPWATLLQAFTSTSVLPGDSVFIRGGVYYIITNGTGVRCTRNGTSDNWITYINYPNEKPIMDFGNMTAGNITYPGLRNDGVVLSEVNYIKLYGLTVRNVKQYFNRNYARGIYLRDGIATIENCIVYDCWGHGIHSQFSVTAKENDTHYIINCDSYNNCDSISGDPLGSNAGATGAGFDAWTDGINGKTYFINCRAWGNSDQGYSIGSDAYMRAEDCWSFDNKAYGNGSGGGFKLGWQDIDTPDLRREIINCVATYNDSYGFFTNENGSGTEEEWNAVKSNHYNNISYNNEGYGFIIQNTRQSEELQRWRNFSNNISYKNGSGNVFDAAGAAKYSGSNNSWDIPLTVNDNDFISLDTTGMTTSRQSDGSLPNNNFYNRFLKLSPTSNLVDAGINVGLPYKGLAPDLGPFEYNPPTQIIADHTVVDKYDDIPQRWIDSVKTMWVSVAGESHSQAYRTGAQLLENINSKYAVSIRESGTPDPYTTNNLRLSRATWGDLNNSSGWIYGYGEEDWYTSTTAINRTKAGLDYCNNNGPVLAALGFGWCWDPDEQVEAMDVYNEVTQEYDEYCRTNDYLTKVFFTTGPVDATNASGIVGYYKYLAYEAIRNYVSQIDNAVLFDYADILCYDDDGTGPNTASYNGNVFPIITQDNVSPEQTGHISNTGALRLGKALWWMLARIAGWDGNPEIISETDITFFTINNQIGPAIINTTNHTVNVQVVYGTDLTSLIPTITVSGVETIYPSRGVAKNFTFPIVYTVT